MWSTSLRADLFWFVTELDGTVRYRQTEYRASSFSCASVDTPYIGFNSWSDDKFDKGGCEPLVVKDLFLDYETPDVFGPVQGGRILVERIVKRISLRSDSPGPVEPSSWILSFEAQALGRSVTTSKSGRSRPLRSTVLLDEGTQYFDPRTHPETLYVIPGATRQYVAALLLIQPVDRDNGSYRRIGFVEVRKELGYYNKDLDPMHYLVTPDEERHLWVETQGGKYLIRLI